MQSVSLLCKRYFTLLLLVGGCVRLSAQAVASGNADTKIAAIKSIGFHQAQGYGLLSELTDVYGQRLTGSREYLRAAKWIGTKMKEAGLQNIHFEDYCPDCRGWSIKGFNAEMIHPNYMRLHAYPLAMSRGTGGIVEGEIIHIVDRKDMAQVRSGFSGRLQGKIILLGPEPEVAQLSTPVFKRLTNEELEDLSGRLLPENEQTPLPALIKSWETSDRADHDFLQFAEEEGALAVLKSSNGLPGILHASGTYYYREGEYKPLPYFVLAPEQFGRLVRASQFGTTPELRLDLETEFYMEPQNNVNILAELTGSDPGKKDEIILVGGHFDSWHIAAGATDNAVNVAVLIEAMRILKKTGLIPKRTIRLGLWGGEEQAFLGSIAYAAEHLGPMDGKPARNAEKVIAYVNLDNGAGAIRGIYLQDNEFAGPVFQEIFRELKSLTTGAVTIENTLSTDHETFDNYHIPSFQFIQDPLAYESITHHTDLDFIEHVPREDMMKNAVIVAWTLYSLGQREEPIAAKMK